MKTRKILLVLTILFAIFGLAKVNAATEVEKVDIEVPIPVLSEVPADKTQVTVKANDSLTFEVLEVNWYIKHSNGMSGKYEIWNDTNKRFHNGATYAVEVAYKRPNEYQNSQTIKVNVNGNSINASNYEEFEQGPSGDADHEYDVVRFEFGQAQSLKNLSKVEITLPEPTVEKTLAKESDVIVKADGSEEFKVNRVTWGKYNPESDSYEEVTDKNVIVKENEKYYAVIEYTRPSKYGISSNTKITVNGKNIDSINITDPEHFFHQGGGGDMYNDYDIVVAEFEAKQAKIENQDKVDNENKIESESKVDNEVTEDTSNVENTVNNPKTGDNVVVYSIALVVAILGIGVSFKIKK